MRVTNGDGYCEVGIGRKLIICGEGRWEAQTHAKEDERCTRQAKEASRADFADSVCEQ